MSTLAAKARFPGTVGRATCRFCGANLRHTFVDLGVQPLCQTHIEVSQLNQMEPFYPLQVFVCENDFLVQLVEVVSPKEIFGEYAYFSSYSDSWLAHAEAFVGETVDRFSLGPSCLVVEIGSNDGYLLQYFVKKGVPVLGIDPAANVVEAAKRKGIPSLVRFFDEQLAGDLIAAGKRADFVVGNNVLAHVPNLNGFVLGIKTLLARQGVVSMEFPVLLHLMEKNQFDTIYHEHFSYFSLLSVERIFADQGLIIFDVDELPTHGGSLRIYARHAEDLSKPVSGRVHEFLRRETEAGFAQLEHYLSFMERVREAKWNLLECLINLKRMRKSIVGYGAPGKGNTLLNYCGIGRDFLDYTVDRNPYKQGKFTPGTHIPIFAPEKIRETRPDHVLILPWNLEQEIRSQLSYIHEWGGKFIIPIPTVRIEP